MKDTNQNQAWGEVDDVIPGSQSLSQSSKYSSRKVSVPRIPMSASLSMSMDCEDASCDTQSAAGLPVYGYGLEASSHPATDASSLSMQSSVTRYSKISQPISRYASAPDPNVRNEKSSKPPGTNKLNHVYWYHFPIVYPLTTAFKGICYFRYVEICQNNRDFSVKISTKKVGM